jgi:hypothetical protein
LALQQAMTISIAMKNLEGEVRGQHVLRTTNKRLLKSPEVKKPGLEKSDGSQKLSPI